MTAVDGGLSGLAWPFLLLLLLIPIGWFWAHRGRLRMPYPRPGLLDGGHRSLGIFWWLWTPAFRSVTLALVAIALFQPVRVWQRIETEREGVAIMLAIDISSSMLAEDFRPDNRIEVAKREVVRFVEGRQDDWIGLVAFAGEALTMVPGTLDHPVVETAVEGLEAGQLRDGTAIGVALATAANRLRELEPESKIVVLLTDGDNNSGSISPMDATEAASALGVRVYTIGVGRDGVAPVPVARTAFGYQYANVRVHVNDELLEEMATRTGGLYFRATDPEGLTEIYERIDALETTPLKEVRTVERVALRREVMFLALAALLLELLGAATRARRVLA